MQGINDTNKENSESKSNAELSEEDFSQNKVNQDTLKAKYLRRKRIRDILFLIRRDYIKWLGVIILIITADLILGCLFILVIAGKNNYRLENIYLALSGLSLDQVVNIAVVAATFLAWLTLIEMKIERNNAYRPDIVIVPRIFEGGKVGTGNLEIDKKYIYIAPDEKSPGANYVGSSFVDMHSLLPNNKYEINELIDTNLLYLEVPYISLKNIGRGTAKSIHVSISDKWLKSVSRTLNENSKGMHKFYIGHKNPGDFLAYCSTDDYFEWTLAIISTEEYDVDITYLISGEDTVHIALPKDWNRVLAVIFSQVVQKYNDPSAAAQGTSFNIPELVLTIRYKDMQGKKFKKKVAIPWNIRYSYETSSDKVEKTMYISTSFFKDYIR